jgi:hypothetical protein
MQDSYDTVDKGCNCHHPDYHPGGRRCGEYREGGIGDCNWCRGKHKGDKTKVNAIPRSATASKNKKTTPASATAQS